MTNRSFATDTIHWQETMNGVTIDCSLDLAIHPAKSNVVLLTIPGVDGSVDGYEDKYIRMVEGVRQIHNVAAVRIANPFITSFHWESNPRRILDYISKNTEAITSSTGQPRMKIVAHSAGASIIARIAHEYDDIADILLINPALKLDSQAILAGLKKTEANVTIIFGEDDPSVSFSAALREDGHDVVVLEGVDHHFTGDSIMDFIKLPQEYLFRESKSDRD
jgi:pimeloyl-ACP methyl ester carboxylesterase